VSQLHENNEKRTVVTTVEDDPPPPWRPVKELGGAIAPLGTGRGVYVAFSCLDQKTRVWRAPLENAAAAERTDLAALPAGDAVAVRAVENGRTLDIFVGDDDLLRIGVDRGGFHDETEDHTFRAVVSGILIPPAFVVDVVLFPVEAAIVFWFFWQILP
jgi:hypothetical protein